jgi:hypothetical protein
MFLLFLFLLLHLFHSVTAGTVRSRPPTIKILSFSTSSSLYHTWNFQADPVMGGKSSGSFLLQSTIGILSGTVRDVPSLQAPGFIKIQTPTSNTFPNVSTCSHLTLEAKSIDTAYQGWRVGIGNSRPSQGRRHASGHKADFRAPTTADTYENISIPFNSFSNYWNPATGDALVSCQEDPQFCPTMSTLSNLQTISIWAEGVNGKVTLHLRGIYADGCNGIVDPSLFPSVSNTDGDSAGSIDKVFSSAVNGFVVLLTVVFLVLP